MPTAPAEVQVEETWRMEKVRQDRLVKGHKGCPRHEARRQMETIQDQ